MGAPCIHDGGGVVVCVVGGDAGAAAGAGLNGACCAVTGHGTAKTPATTAANNNVREFDKTEFMAIPPITVSSDRLSYLTDRYINSTRG